MTNKTVADAQALLVEEITNEREALLAAELLREPVHVSVPIIQRLDLGTLITLKKTCVFSRLGRTEEKAICIVGMRSKI